jgi:hypothetical protein
MEPGLQPGATNRIRVTNMISIPGANPVLPCSPRISYVKWRPKRGVITESEPIERLPRFWADAAAD